MVDVRRKLITNPSGSQTSLPHGSSRGTPSGSQTSLPPLYRSKKPIVVPQPDMTQADMRQMFHEVTPQGFTMMGGRGEEQADEYYPQEDGPNEILQTPRQSSVVGTPGSSNAIESQDRRPLISKNGKGFGSHTLHTNLMDIVMESLDHPWATFKQIPSENLKQMFERFRTRYRWHPEEEGSIYTAFKYVIKDRYRDRLLDAKHYSKRLAIEDQQPVTEINDSFEILRNYAPRHIHIDIWRKLCDLWNTDKWKKNALIAKNNRNTPDSFGLTARHTGGSIGPAEHRLRLKKMMVKEPDWLDVFCQTRLKAPSKAKHFSGDLEGLQFCTGTAKEAYEAFKNGLVEKYGDDPTQQVTADPELWCDTQIQRQGGKNKGRIYGIGSSDLHFAVTGKYSSGASSSTGDSQSQQEVQSLREEIEKMRNDMKEKEDERELKMQEREAQLELRMQQREMQLQEQMNAFFSQFKNVHVGSDYMAIIINHPINSTIGQFLFDGNNFFFPVRLTHAPTILLLNLHISMVGQMPFDLNPQP